jgi:hypothetical protein
LPRLIRCDLLGCRSQRALASADAAALDLPRSHYGADLIEILEGRIDLRDAMKFKIEKAAQY